MVPYKQQSFPFKVCILAVAVLWVALAGVPIEAQRCDAKVDRKATKLEEAPASLDPGNCAAMVPEEAFRCALATQVWAWLESQGRKSDFDTVFFELGSAAANGRADDMVFDTQSGSIMLLEGLNAFTIQPPPVNEDNGDPSTMIHVIDTLHLEHTGIGGDVMLLVEGIDVEGNGVYLGSFVLGAGQSLSLGFDGSGSNPLKGGGGGGTVLRAAQVYAEAGTETVIAYEDIHRARGLEAVLSCDVVLAIFGCNYCSGTCHNPNEICLPVEPQISCWGFWEQPEKCKCR